jgi:hypothetical protein
MGAPDMSQTNESAEEVLERNSFLDILGHFMFIEKRDEAEG